MARVKLTDVKKVYDNNVTAVHDFNLDIKDKEFVVFVGPSGCGKSTTLRMIAGLEDISSGTCEIGDTVVNDLQPKDRDIAMVFQNYALYPHMTVYDNIAFSLRLKKVPEDQIYQKVTDAAEILGITEYLTRKPRALSGGQRQRVAIGRAIVRDPAVFLMDEPLSNLDAKLRNQMRAEIIMLRKRVDTTFIYVTHDQTEAMTLGDRIVIMKDGYIMQVGTPQEVFFKPQNLFVAGFIGSPQMNFIDSTLTEQGGKYTLKVQDYTLDLDDETCARLSARKVKSGTVTAGIRPEHMTCTFEDTPNALHATVTVHEMMGSELHVHAALTGSGQNIILRLPTIELEEKKQAMLGSGRECSFVFAGRIVQLFDKETEKSLLW